MPYIPPNSDVVLCRGVPIDSDYKHTLYFDSVAAQNNYFFSKAFKQFHHVSYQRERRNVMTLETPSSELYGCNYLLFKNTSYSEKWFFAFVDLVEYVSDTVTDIYYTIDMMQTWMFQYTLKQCFVAREHSATDNLFENTKNESVGYGKLMCGVHGDVLKASEQLTMCAVLTTKPFTSGVGAEKPLEIYNRHCSVYGYIGLPQAINDNIELLVQNGYESAILALFIVPSFFAQGATDLIMPTSMPTKTVEIEFNIDELPNGYKPRNKKLLSYPYNQLWISNNSGTINEYRYEDFELTSNNTVEFELKACGVTSPAMSLVPLHYRGVTKYYDEAIFSTNFTTAPWVGDVYAAWVAQNKNSVMASAENQAGRAFMNLGQSLVGGFIQTNNTLDMYQAQKYDAANRGLSVSKATQVGAQQSVRQNLLNTLSVGANEMFGFWETVNTLEGKVADLQNIPANVHNLSQADSLNAADKKMSFETYRMCVKPEYAKMVDKYFDMFGYTTNEVKVPNTHSRPHWNYVQTVGCEIQGLLPQEAANIIKAVYDKGVTFWKNGDEVGNYTLDNSPT